MVDNFKKWNPSKLTMLLLLIVPFSIYTIYPFELSGDFWFLCNLGKSIIYNGFITVDLFTIHSGLSFIPQQWLTDIIFYVVYSKCGVYGLFILIIILNGLIIFLTYKLSKLLSNSKSISLLITISSNIILLAFGLITARPHIFDLILLLSELYIMEEYTNNKNTKLLYVIPLLSFLYINLHASTWPMFFLFLMPYYIEYIYLYIKKKNVIDIKKLSIVAFLSFVFGFINPYTYRSVLYFINSYVVKEINMLVGEMKQLSFNNGFSIIILIVLSFILLIKSKDKKIRYILLHIITIYITINHLKGFLYFMISFVIIFSLYFKNRNKINKGNHFNNREKALFISAVILFLLIMITNVKIKEYPSIKQVADYLDNNADKNIKVYTNAYSGTYLEYRGYKCYIDNRAEVFIKRNNKKEDIYKEYYELLTDKIDYNEFITKYEFDYIMVDNINNRKMIEYLNSNNLYKEVFNGYDDVNKTEYYLYKKSN